MKIWRLKLTIDLTSLPPSLSVSCLKEANVVLTRSSKATTEAGKGASATVGAAGAASVATVLAPLPLPRPEMQAMQQQQHK